MNGMKGGESERQTESVGKDEKERQANIAGRNNAEREGRLRQLGALRRRSRGPTLQRELQVVRQHGVERRTMRHPEILDARLMQILTTHHHHHHHHRQLGVETRLQRFCLTVSHGAGDLQSRE
jgi:hypothetical protein